MMNRVLLADDELHILRAAEFRMKRHGFEVVCANDGEEAWEILCEQRVDLLVTDFQMPRLSGLDLIRRLRERPELQSLPVFMLTAKGYELPQRELAETLGIIEIIDKPFSPRELCNRVQTALDRAQEATRSPNEAARLAPSS